MLPAEAVLLARSARYPDQAFRIGPSGYGVQFHDESSLATIRGMTELDSTAANSSARSGPAPSRRRRQRSAAMGRSADV